MWSHWVLLLFGGVVCERSDARHRKAGDPGSRVCAPHAADGKSTRRAALRTHAVSVDRHRIDRRNSSARRRTGGRRDSLTTQSKDWTYRNGGSHPARRHHIGIWEFVVERTSRRFETYGALQCTAASFLLRSVGLHPPWDVSSHAALL